MNNRLPPLTPMLLAALGFIGAVSPLASDMYLASFGSIQRDLSTTASMVQLTLSVFFIGTAAGQLVIGPLSDTLGRRRPLLAALAIYAAAGIVLIFTPSIELFIATRLLLGFTGAAGIVLARAIAADLSQGETAVKALSIIAMVGGLGPLLAPPIGGLTHELWGWRGTMATLAAISVAMLVIAWCKVPESLPLERRKSTGLLASFTPIGGLLRTPKYLLFMLTFALSFGVMISYIAASPFVGQVVLKMPALLYALGFSLSGTSMVVSNILNAKVAVRVGPWRMLTVGLLLMMLGATGMLALSLTGLLTPWGFIACAFVLCGGASFGMSNASALALAEASHVRGVGAALMGASQFALGGLLAPLVGVWGAHTAVPMGAMVFATAAAASLCALLGKRAPRR